MHKQYILLQGGLHQDMRQLVTFEFGTFFGMMLVGAFIVMYFMYRVSIIGLFALPVALLLIAYASMFPRKYLRLFHL